MRRLAFIACAVGAAVVLAAVAGIGCGASAGEARTYRVDAIFDNASFLVPGQDLRIAGVNAGSVAAVRLTPGHRARISLEVEREFAPFRSDADCFIAPQSLIGERFVQCAPGTPRAPVLRARGGRPPTVPLGNTHSPVDPDLVLSTFDLPMRDRLSIILNELGTGLAANGRELSAAVRRSNPAIQATRRVLAIVDADRDVLGRLIDRSDEVIGELAGRRDRVAALVDDAQRVTGTVARRDDEVSEGIRRLPSTLDETRASLDALRDLADRSRPLLGDVRAATPALTRLVDDVPPFATAARPAMRRLAAMSRTGTRTVHDAAPVARRLRTFARLSVPAGRLVAALTESLRDRGAVEGLQYFYYNIALAISRYDRVSHILPAYLVAPPGCAEYARTTTPSCDAHFVKGAATTTGARAEPVPSKGRLTPQPPRQDPPTDLLELLLGP